jgi:hypothetical protein
MTTLEQMKERNWEVSYVLFNNKGEICGYEITDGKERFETNAITVLKLAQEGVLRIDEISNAQYKIISDDFKPNLIIGKGVLTDGTEQIVPIEIKDVRTHPGYKELKNLIHNELKITREEIHDMIKTLVKNEVYALLESKRDYIMEIVEKYLREHIRHELYLKSPINSFDWRVKHALTDEIGKYIAEKLNIEISLK